MTFEYIRQSLFFFRNNFKTLAIINLPFIILSYFIFAQFDLSIENQTPEQLANTMLVISGFNLLFMPIYWGASIVFMQSSMQEKIYSPSQCIVASIKLWPQLLVVFFFYTLFISLGFMAFIVPGIYFGIRLSLADYICVTEKRSTMQCFKQSWERTAQYFWPLFQGIGIITIGILLLRSFTLSFFDGLFPDSQSLRILLNTGFDLMNVLVLIYGFRIYCLIKTEL
ncbi:MAG: YciC family protein [Oceanospirillaceae bacterium]